jgi:adenine-specific DNA-methyltransferase
VDFEVLKQLLGGTVDEREEKYGLNWHGKRRARQIALTPSTGTLRPCPEDSVDWDTTRNLMIEGDNLEVLKLLQKSYAGKVKLIYIDPPYNIGKDVIYPDNFQDSIRNYLELTGQVDGVGRKLLSNTEASGRFHTNWLNMMYPRLKLARNLLRDDGVIFVSIDDSEASHLRRIADDIFGEENFVSSIVWRKRVSPANDAQWYSSDHEYLVVYSRNKESWFPNRTERNEDHNQYYKNPDNDSRGPWNSAAYTCNKSKAERPNLYYAIVNPNTRKEIWPDEKAVWAYSKETHLRHVAENLLYWGADGESRSPRKKQFLTEAQPVVPRSLWDYSEVGSTQSATTEMRDLGSGFGYPKPSTLIRKAVYQATRANSMDIILDFFAGSGTAGHAVMAQNAADGGTRRYILVQLPEPLDPENKDQKTAADFCDQLGKPRTIAELTKERLRRAGKKIKEENPLFAGDLGFRVFKLASSNIRAWEPDRENLAATLAEHAEHLKTERTEADILFELLLKLGLDLTVPIEKKTIAGKTVHSIGVGTLLVCLAAQIAAAQVEPLALGIVFWYKQLAPAGETQVVFRDSAFADDVAKTNLTAILQQHGLDNVRSL